MNTHDLAKHFLKLDNVPLLISIDVSTCDEDANLRATGEEIIDIMEHCIAGCNPKLTEIVLVVNGELNEP